MGHKLPSVLAQRRDSNAHGEMCDFAEFAIQRFKFKKSIAAITILEILEEDGKRENRRGRKTRGWIRRIEEKGYYNNIVHELMIEDTPGYCE